MASKVWLITGTTSGFGLRLAHSALARGDRVIATARSVEKLEEFVKNCDDKFRDNLRTLQLDINEGEVSLRAKADKAVAMWGQIDVLVNNAGIGFPGLVEENGTALIRKQFETNVFGLMDVTMAFLPHLRARGEATLVVIGSRTFFKTVPGIGPYAASKSAVHALTDTLAVELAPLGVRVLLVAPGSFRTEGIYGQGYSCATSIKDYDDIRTLSRQRIGSIAGLEKGDPKKAMEVVVDVVRGEGVAKGKSWPGILVLGEDAEKDARERCMKVLEVLDEWKDVSRGVSFD